jgi:hypothetical protein
MKNLKLFSFVVVIIFLFVLISCDRDIQVDYHTVCSYYIDNKTDVDYFAEFEVNPSFLVNPQDTTLYIVTLKAQEKTQIQKVIMDGGHWFPTQYFDYLLIKDKNGDTIIYEKPIVVDESWQLEKYDISKDGYFWNERWTYVIE